MSTHPCAAKPVHLWHTHAHSSQAPSQVHVKNEQLYLHHCWCLSYVDAEDDEGNTPLHYAADKGHLECVNALLEKSDADAENEEGNTPVWLAIQNGHVEVGASCLAKQLQGRKTEVTAPS